MRWACWRRKKSRGEVKRKKIRERKKTIMVHTILRCTCKHVLSLSSEERHCYVCFLASIHFLFGFFFLMERCFFWWEDARCSVNCHSLKSVTLWIQLSIYFFALMWKPCTYLAYFSPLLGLHIILNRSVREWRNACM